MPKIVYHDSEGVEKSVELGADPIFIGRAPECQIQTQDGLVSRRHARIVYDGSYWIEDLGSANGVYVGSQRVQRAQIRPGDEALCGSLTLRFEADVAAAIRRTQGLSAVTDDMIASSATPLRAADAGVSQAIEGSTGPRRQEPPPAVFAPPLAAPLPVAILPPVVAPPPGPPPGPADAELRAERDRLRVRVGELEGQLAASRVGGDDQERTRLQRRVDQLQSENRRLRGGEAPPEPAPDSRIAELEGQVRRVEAERDEALRQSTPAPKPDEPAQKAPVPPDPRVAEDLERARRQIDQLQAELRRRTSSMTVSPSSPDLEAALRQLRDVERERDSLRTLVAAGGGPPKIPARVIECLNALSDGLADIRAALHAAGDDLALEQLEQTRARLKEIFALLDLSP